MIATASLALSKRLHELAPEWKSDLMYWKRLVDDYDQVKVLRYGSITTRDGAMVCFAPDLDWLLGKLPRKLSDKQGYPSWLKVAAYTETMYQATYGIRRYRQFATTPCDAVCMLLIKLLEYGEIKI